MVFFLCRYFFGFCLGFGDDIAKGAPGDDMSDMSNEDRFMAESSCLNEFSKNDDLKFGKPHCMQCQDMLFFSRHL